VESLLDTMPIGLGLYEALRCGRVSGSSRMQSSQTSQVHWPTKQHRQHDKIIVLSKHQIKLMINTLHHMYCFSYNEHKQFLSVSFVLVVGLLVLFADVGGLSKF